jgi:adenylyltransferase/sulfurtransferase
MGFERYKRNLSIIGVLGQEKLLNASVLIVGCGGIGCPLSLYLAGAGIGKISLIDDDVIELSNLQRQVAYSDKDIGYSKVYTLATKLRELNPTIKVVGYNTRLNSTNAENVLTNYDLIIDGSDNFQTRYLINDICCKLTKNFISVSVLNDLGQLSFFDIENGCYRCLYPKAPPVDLFPSCSGGVLGPSVGVISTMCAQMIVNMIARDVCYMGKSYLFNGMTLEWSAYSYKQDNSCEACVEKKVSIVDEEIESDVVFDNTLNISDYTKISDFFIIDIRDDWEQELLFFPEKDSHVLYKDLISSYDFESLRDQSVLLCCTSGVRSRKAALFLRKKGYAKVFSLEKGIDSYLCYRASLEK